MYLGLMSKNFGVEAKVARAIQLRLADHTQGRRSLRWLSDRTGISRATLQSRMKHPINFTTGELARVADAFGVPLEDLYADA